MYGDNFVHCVYYFHVVVLNLHTNCTQHEEGKVTCIPAYERVKSGKEELRIHNTPVNIYSPLVSQRNLTQVLC